MENKIGIPEKFTDAEAEAFIRYLTQIEKPRKKTLAELLLETDLGKTAITLPRLDW